MRGDIRETNAQTSLYRCSVCGYVVRLEPGRDSLGHLHYDQDGNYLGKEAEGRFVEFEDDGRGNVEDLRDSTWLA